MRACVEDALERDEVNIVMNADGPETSDEPVGNHKV